ncbi:MAG: hypothetical protein VXV96_08245 [Bdellovibrionota bacterium]|nr:hypothetical protein [Bdellovibrionota bacterium]
MDLITQVRVDLNRKASVDYLKWRIKFSVKKVKLKSIRNFLSAALILSASLQPTFADEPVMDLESLKEQYTAAVTSMDPIGAVTGERGKTAMEAGQRFIKANPNLKDTPAGAEFLRIHNKFARLRALKEKLDNCVSDDLNDPMYTNRLPERLLEAAWVTPDTEIPCNISHFEAESVDDLMASIRGITDTLTTEDQAKDMSKFQENIYLQGLENSIKTITALKYTYNEELGKKSELSDEDVATHILPQICSRTTYNPGPGPREFKTNQCSDSQKNYLTQRAKQEFLKLKRSGEKQYSPADAAEEIRSRITQINEVILNNELDVTEGWIRDSANMDTEKSRAAHQAYVTSFMENAKSGPGLLMWTNAVGGKMGSRRDRDEASMFGLIGGGFDRSNGTFKTHDTSISTNDVRGAISEAEERVMEQVQKLHNQETIRKSEMSRMSPDAAWYNSKLSPASILENRRESLKEIVATNPVLVGQSLMKDPTKVDEACTVISDIAQEAKDNEGFTWGKAIAFGGLVVGGALLLATGVGAVALLTGAVAGAAGATVTSVGAFALAGATFKGLAVAGFAYGVAETTVYGTRYLQAAEQRDELISSYLAGAGDQETADEFLIAMDEAEDALFNAAFAAGFTLLDVPGAMAIARHLKGTERMQFLKEIKEAYSLIRKSGPLKQNLTLVKNTMGKANVQKVLKELSKLEKPSEIFKKLEKMGPAEMTEFFRKGLDACTEMCGV